MLDVQIFPAAIKKTIAIRLSKLNPGQNSRAILLGSSGEQLQVFQLSQIENELCLDGFKNGGYSLRIESGNDVLVKQIIIP